MAHVGDAAAAPFPEKGRHGEKHVRSVGFGSRRVPGSGPPQGGGKGGANRQQRGRGEGGAGLGLGLPLLDGGDLGPGGREDRSASETAAVAYCV